MKRSGVITITTDFGHKGPVAAAMKGVILGRYPDAKIVDLIHWQTGAGLEVDREL